MVTDVNVGNIHGQVQHAASAPSVSSGSVSTEDASKHFFSFERDSVTFLPTIAIRTVQVANSYLHECTIDTPVIGSSLSAVPGFGASSVTAVRRLFHLSNRPYHRGE